MRADKIFAMFLGAYLALALAGKLMLPRYLGAVNSAALLYALIFSLLIFLGYRLSDRLPGERLYFYMVAGILMGASAGIPGVVFSLLVLVGGLFMVETEGIYAKYAYYGGIFLMLVLPLIAMLEGVIPVLEPQTRYMPLRNLYFASAIFATILLAYRPNIYLFLTAEAFAIISTFRTNALIVFLAYIFRAKKEEIKRIALIGIPLILLAFFVRFYATRSVYSIWKLGFVETLLYRAGFSYMVYEKLFSLGMPFGKLGLLLNPKPRALVASLFGKSTNYTYTLFGQPAYDFGIFGLVEGFLIGMALADSERQKMFKPLALTFLILALEIGLDALNLGIIVGSALFSLGIEEGISWRRKG